MDIGKRRRITASSMFKRNKKDAVLNIFLLGFLLVGIFFFSRFIKDFSTGAETKRMKSLIEEKTSKAGFDKDFFERNFTKKTIDVFGIRRVFAITANDLGENFWKEDFTKMVQESENEAIELVSLAEQINRTSSDKNKKNIDLTEYPLIFNLIKYGKSLSLSTKFNLADGDISLLWKKAFLRYEALNKAKSNIILLEKKLFLNEQEKTLSQKEIDETNNKIKNYKDFIETTEILPDMKNLKAFIPYADSSLISLDENKGTVQINSLNTSIDLASFKEALFLKILSNKLPERMNYFAVLGDRHGMWKLDLKYKRWSVSIDDPYELTDFWRGAVALRAEKGFFAITHKKENYIMIPLDKNPSEEELSSEFKKNYIFDRTQNKYFKIYDFPIDWRTGLPAEKNLSALVLEDDPVKARMMSTALYLSEKNEINEFQKNFEKVKFVVLYKDQTVYVSESAKNDFIPKDKLTRKK